MLDDRVVTELSELISANPGSTEVYLQLHDATGKNHVLLRSKSKRRDVKNDLLKFIEQTASLDYKIN